MLMQDEYESLRNQRDELLKILNQDLVVPSLDAAKRDEYRERVAKAEAKMSQLSAEFYRLEEYYKSIKVPALVRYEMYEESPVKGQSRTIVQRGSMVNSSDRREFSIAGPHISSSYEKNSLLKKSVSGNQMIDLPALPQDLVRDVEKSFFKRRGPVVAHRRVGKSFAFGTREFVVTRQSGQIMAKDVPQDHSDSPAHVGSLPEQMTFIPIETYLNKYEKEERQKCKAINLSLINDG